jgi:RNA polymerase sigma-70 factor (ECF subfamily)
LLAGVKADDSAAWDRLVTLYAPLVFHWCRQWRLPEEDASDIFQEVFQSVAAHIGAFRKDQRRDTFRGWLRTITRNKVYDHFRRQGDEPRAAGGSTAQFRLSQVAQPPLREEECREVEESLERSLFQRGLELIRGEFAQRTWQAFWRTAVDGLTPKDVGEELSMTSGAVRVAKSRVLQRLREELGDLEEQ